ncbi:MAG: 6-bladed beta-propeller [Planctomycetes bacterium]|nr:6-bladed beta-propeller [Planctomycetota bacterium]
MRMGRTLCLLLLSLAVAGCDAEQDNIGRLDLVWGRHGISDGRFQKPRAMAIDAQDRIYVIDMTARIQVLDANGNFLRGWRTPAWETGKPTGASIDRAGRLLVADTHYYRLLIYTPEGELVQTIGGVNGPKPGDFGLVTDAVEDSHGYYYISEYGEWDRIQKFTRDGQFVMQWGGHGTAPGQFMRPQNMEIDQDDQIWVADACNHRIQVFDTSGKLLKYWGIQGTGPGELSYPYDLFLDGEGHVYVVEFGNHRVQKFTLDGQSLGCWGRHGRRDGELNNPWAVVRDSRGRIHVVDAKNHRIQRVVM